MFSTLWMSITTKAKDSLFDKIFKECLVRVESELSLSLRRRLQFFSISERKEILSGRRRDLTPLGAACFRGNVKVAQYLIEHCGLDVDQSVTTEVFVTPLWTASSEGNLSVVRYLVERGANVNIVSDLGRSTAVNIACKNRHYKVATYLIENNADVLIPDYRDVTCFMHSLNCLPLCELLIQHGADVNAKNADFSTALHLAISENRFSVMELLLENGADPFLKDKHGNDALITACLEMIIPAFEYLCKNCNYSRNRIAEAHELIGSTYLEKKENEHMCLHHWHLALSIRYTENPNEAVPKDVASKVPYGHIPEFNSVEELKKISENIYDMYTQSLHVRERILGSSHMNTIYYLKSRANYYLRSSEYKSFIDHQIYLLKIIIRKDTLLDINVCREAKSLTVKFLLIHQDYQTEPVHDELIVFHDVFELMDMLTCQLESCNSLLAVKPVFKAQQYSYNTAISVLIHLIYLLCVIPKTPDQVITMKNVIRKALQIDPRTSDGDTLLHLVVSKSNFIQPSIFPDAEVLEFLLECGASVGTVNYHLNTPLHVAALPSNFIMAVIHLLLKYGAHIDQRNVFGNSPHSMLQNYFEYNIDYLQFTTLKCLAACKIMEKQIPFIGKVPLLVEEFIRIHGRQRFSGRA